MKRRNPYERKGVAKFVAQGTPWPQEWEYEGWTITVRPVRIGKASYSAWTIGPEGQEDTTTADTPHEALARMRLRIDRRVYEEKLPLKDQEAFRTMHNIVHHAGARALAKHSLNRATVARFVEEARKKPVMGMGGDIREAYRFFDRLPLKDRVAWIDSVIKSYEWSGIKAPAKRKARNPRKKKRDTRANRRSILRRLLRT